MIIMKKTIFFVLIAILGGSASMAQGQIKDEWQVFKDAFKREKKDIVSDYMRVSPDQASKFWPVYEEYGQKRAAIGKDRINIIGDYGSQLSGITDDQAKDLANRIMKNDKSLLKLDQKYFKKFNKAVGGVKAAQYMQMEQYFTTTVKSAIQENIPFIGEVHRAASH